MTDTPTQRFPPLPAAQSGGQRSRRPRHCAGRGDHNKLYVSHPDKIFERNTLTWHVDIPLGQVRAERQKALLRWEFICKCPLCSASETEVEASDAKLTRIAELRATVAAAVAKRATSSRAAKQSALETVRDLFPRLIEEDLFTAYSEQYASIGRLFWALGDAGQARFYAQRSLDVLADQGFLAEGDRHKVELVLRTF